MRINPVLAKELRDRVRTWRSPLMITLYTGVLALIGGLFYYTQTRFDVGGPRTLRLGIEIFDLLFFLQLLLIAFLTPGITAGIISGERERQTLPLLLVTRLSSFSVVAGKLLSAVSYILLLIVISLPLYSVVFLFGGVSPVELLQAAGLLLAATLTFGSLGLFCSALFKRTTVAVVVSYALTLFLLAGTLFFSEIIRELAFTGKPQPQPLSPPWLIYLSPLVALGSVLPAGNGVVPFAGGRGMGWSPPPLPYWQMHLIMDGGLILLTLGFAVWLVHPLRAGRKRGE